MFFEGMYDSLFVLDENGQVVPDLVTNFEYNEDQTQLTLDLDTSATFEDGSTLSAELVKENLDARGNPDLSAYSGFAAGGENEIVDVIVVDEDTVDPYLRRAQARLRGEPRHARRRDRRARPARPTAPRSTRPPTGRGRSPSTPTPLSRATPTCW